MMQGRRKPGVVVMGRGGVTTGIATITRAAVELFSRSVPVVFFPLDGSKDTELVLPSGRSAPVVGREDLADYDAFFFADVLWNGAHDRRYQHVPEHGLRIAHLAYDSDELPPEWVTILNERFDAVLFSSAYLVEVAKRSGVEIIVGTLPIGLDLECLIGRTFRPVVGTRVRFGAVASYHDRKGLEIVARAFAAEFAPHEADLVLHSNLAFGDTYQRVYSIAGKVPAGAISLSSKHLDDHEKDQLIDNFDVFVSSSAGEGYSIGPREALALGKPVVLSGIPAHTDLGKCEGMFFVAPSGTVPARYPEIDNRTFGRQAIIAVDDLRAEMRRAYDFALTKECEHTAHERKRLAGEFTNTALEADYRRLLDPTAPVTTRWSGSRFTSLPIQLIEKAKTRAGRAGERVGRRRIVIPLHDGGFFSIFNTYVSHLVWSFQESSPPMVLPDWRPARMLEGSGGKVVSYCYSRPEDGNLWPQFFEPMYGLSADDYNDDDLLTRGVESPDALHNDHKEPWLTYTHPYKLYHASWFAKFRAQYAAVVRDHIRLVPEYQRQIDALARPVGGPLRVAVHVKHPAHALEQPDGRIAGYERYVSEVARVLDDRGIKRASTDWEVFVATDQSRVITEFRAEFGDRVVSFEDVDRVDEQTQAEFDTLSDRDKVKDGHQLQHLKAADPSTWSTRLLWEVWRDVHMLAQSDVVLHAVSNVATALSYLGPDVEMRYCDPDER